jgi:hypothetical protein
MQVPDELVNANYKASHFYLLCTKHACRQCGLLTRVFALAMPASHQSLYWDDDNELADVWQPAEVPTVLYHVTALTAAVSLRLQELAPRYRMSPNASNNARWTNHCDHCHERLDDDDLHCELEAAFMPTSIEAARAIHLIEVLEPIQVNATDSALDAQWLPDVSRH